MRKRKTIGGTAGKGGVNSAPFRNNMTVRVAAEQLLLMPIDELVPYVNNARIHSPAQIAQLRASLREFGFVTPVLIDFENNIIAGHGRVEAARAEGLTEVPCVLVSNLTEAQRKAYILADNRLSENASWAEPMLKIELESLRELNFDTGIIGFAPDQPLEFAKIVSVSEYTRAAPGQGGANAKEIGDAIGQEETEEYRAFVDKFAPKKTTDDCYTPERVYQAVKNWAVEHYGLGNAEILRPFYPGGDYQNAEYPDGCAVIDNPPFSILSEICRFYNERKIPFFLFAPTLTLFSFAAGTCNYVLADADITYENGAVVNTSFVTNLGRWKFEVDPGLCDLLASVIDELRGGVSKRRARYVYPPEVLTVGANSLCRYRTPLRIKAEDMLFVRSLDAQRKAGTAIYGAGFLLSECAGKERAAAEAVAAEKAASTEITINWTLSEREKEIVKSLG